MVSDFVFINFNSNWIHPRMKDVNKFTIWHPYYRQLLAYSKLGVITNILPYLQS